MQETWVQFLEKKMQPTPVFLPGKFHEQQSLVGLQPMGSQRVRGKSSTLTISLCWVLSTWGQILSLWSPFFYTCLANQPSSLAMLLLLLSHVSRVWLSCHGLPINRLILIRLGPTCLFPLSRKNSHIIFLHRFFDKMLDFSNAFHSFLHLNDSAFSQ